MKTIKDLALALVNATLILLAVCLFLGWQVFAAAERTSGNLATAVETIRPLRADIAETRDELKGLRDDLAVIRTGNASLESPAAQALEARVAALTGRMEQVDERIAEIGALRDTLFDQMLDAGTARLTRVAQDIRGCAPEA